MYTLMINRLKTTGTIITGSNKWQKTNHCKWTAYIYHVFIQGASQFVPHIHPFIHTFIHQRPCKAASSSGAVRVIGVLLRDTSTLRWGRGSNHQPSGSQKTAVPPEPLLPCCAWMRGPLTDLKPWLSDGTRLPLHTWRPLETQWGKNTEWGRNCLYSCWDSQIDVLCKVINESQQIQGQT